MAYADLSFHRIIDTAILKTFNMYYFTINLAHTYLPVSLTFKETGRYFHAYGFGLQEADENSVGEGSSKPDELMRWLPPGQKLTPFMEYSLLCIPISQRLMSHGACLFHAGAFRWRDRAFLIAGPSGVGKSSRLKALMEMHPDEISVINGDKPALITREEGSVLVCPSPWNGKEGWHGAKEATLGGVFILQRGEEDLIRPAKNTEKAAILLLSIFQTWESEESLKAAGSIADKIGRSAPVWHLTGHDIGQSAELIYDQLQKEAERLGL